MRRSALVVALALLAGGAVAGPRAVASPTQTVKQPVIAVLDTGVRATHKEFSYGGPRSTSDQFVAWWDFTTEKKGAEVLPQAGQLWDTKVKDPYDGNGHGTLTASMAAGRGADKAQTPSANPGGLLAVGRVVNSGGSVSTALADAVDWAHRTVHADVISISIGSIVPVPSAVAAAVFDAIAAARADGILVVVANGNGYADVGVPGDPGWANLYSSSTDVLAVGAMGGSAYTSSTDPEVTAVYDVVGPSTADDKSYVSNQGTSFGAPYVAGFAASLLRAARQAGKPLPVDTLETLLKYSATDTSLQPAFEGYGQLTDAELPRALGHARAGTLPARPATDLNAFYVEDVAGTLRLVWQIG